MVETHGRWINIALGSMHEFEIGIEPDDVVLHIAPVTHASGTLVLPHVIRGAANCLLPKPDIEAFFETVQRERVTRTLLVPTLINAIVSHPRIDDVDLSSLRHIVYGSSPIAPDLLRRATERFGPIFEQYYGLAEYAPATILRASDHHKTGSAGRVVLDTELKIGEAGEVLLRGPGAFSGYWRDPERTAQVITEDGWVHTGDVGYLDDDGFLYLIDRTSNMIITGGFNVFPASIENALTDHPAVHECAVIGVPDERWGEAVTAVVVATGQPQERELIDFLRGKVATYEVPKAVRFVDDLPKSANGKVLHRELRARFT
jgi:acyl-CoA synthetase (AMP-forming)/AMP-acid ligase II